MSDPVETLRAFGAAITRGEPTVAADLFAPDATYEEPPAPMLRGRAALLAFFTDFAARHSDVSFTISRAFADASNTHVAAEWRFTYTRTEDGTHRVYEGISILDLTADGRIARWRGFSA
ncbi:MAG TPA: nuclear transport factor 2 family protein, partial [Ktedonobacterales bacterium]|nr:nuclear transport factor 2 family protein [Ktedonobacterales bacterium]